MLSKTVVSRALATVALGLAPSIFVDGPALAAPSAGHGTTSTGDRPTLVLDKGWRFRLDPAQGGPEQPDFDDTAWQAVSVPHTWNRVGTYRSDPATHINTPATIDKTMGVGWYRLAFRAPAAFAGKRAFLQFDAASRIAEVWLNGVRLGTHKGGFSRFRFDATQALKRDADNVLAVRVDNTRPAPGSSTADVLPLAGDFFVHGGLYRPVTLVGADPVHVDLLDHGGSGVVATTEAIDGANAKVRVAARLRNDGGKTGAVRLVARLEEPDGRVVAQSVQPLRLAASGNATATAMLDVAGAHLWNGVADPFLYSLVVEVQDGRGRLLDRFAQPFGVRQMAFDPQTGFRLNGKPYVLRGVGYHQDREGKGWAISPADVAEDLATMREMGATTIRLTHYQHGQPVHDLADRLGLVVWDEIPLVSQWTFADSKTARPALLENARQQLAEEIAQDGNHASVATWSIANEVDFGNSLPGFVAGYTGTPPDPAPILDDLDALAHRLDPSRPTALATCCEGRLFASGVDVPITATRADLAGANRYYGWYYGDANEVGASLDALHARRPGQPLALTEYGAGGAINIHTDNPAATQPDSRGRIQPEEVESLVHEQTWAQISKRPYLWATWLWSAFDFASTVRHEGDADDINTKGLVTYDHKTRKDAFWFYKANWTATPTVHITGSRYVQRAYPVTQVRVYSNAPSTSLAVNGRLLGDRAQCELGVCVWDGVRLDAGRNAITATGHFPSGETGDAVAWSLDAGSAHAFRIDAGALVAATSAAGRFGSDDFFEGGKALSVDKPADYGKPAVPTPIAGTADRDLVATMRQGAFTYRLPVEAGRYTVQLTFVEPSARPGERVFEVSANGRMVLSALDIAEAAGAPLTAVQRRFAVDVTGGSLDLVFRPVKGDAVVSAIEVTPGSR